LGLGLAILLVGSAACGAPTDDPRCVARDALRDAVRAVQQAESAETSGDAATVRRHMDEVARLVGTARARLGRADPSGTDGAARQMAEAANYLEFIVDDFAETDAVDGALAQFATRELERAVPGNDAPLSC
jgi:hypothetical protein